MLFRDALRVAAIHAKHVHEVTNLVQMAAPTASIPLLFSLDLIIVMLSLLALLDF